MRYFLVVVAVVLVPVAIFLSGDADIGLLLSPSPPQMSYANQVIWITGASSGIGAATAIEFKKLGAQVIISARREDKLYALSNASQGQGTHEMFVLPLDLMDFESHEKAYQTILEKFGHVDILILNAGQSQRNPALDTPFADTRSLMELNFFACVHLAKVVVPGMITYGGGKLVLMSSLSGKLGTPIGSSYSASKFALHGYFDALRSELADQKISVVMVCPGPVESEIHLHTKRAAGTAVTSEGKKMPIERFMTLFLRGMYNGYEEMWISEQPYLFFTYANVFTPWFGRQVAKMMGPQRVKALKTGENIFDIKKFVTK